MYDITDPQSFERLDFWMEEFLNEAMCYTVYRGKDFSYTSKWSYDVDEDAGYWGREIPQGEISRTHPWGGISVIWPSAERGGVESGHPKAVTTAMPYATLQILKKRTGAPVRCFVILHLDDVG